VTERQVLADREHRFEAPVWVVFDALTVGQRHWLELQPGEVEPHVLDALPVERVVWSSFWTVSPHDTIEFDLVNGGRPGRRAGVVSEGTTLRFRWFSSSPPDERGVAITRQRLNRKFASGLRAWVDSAFSAVSWEPPTDRT
jgi:hypothetical protein